jgi:cbb3-type cytochrome oxidase subunit 3
MMITISNKIRNDKYFAVVPLILAIATSCLLMFIFNFILMILSIIFLGIAIAVYLLSKKKWKIQFDSDKKLIIVSDKKKSFQTDLFNISNIIEYSHFTPRDAKPYTNYCLYFTKSISIGKAVSFTIYDRETELKENYDNLRSVIVELRSRKAKEMVDSTGN